MGNRSYSQQVHHHSNTVNTTRSSKTFFLPMFCRLSVNDVARPAKLADLSSSISSSPDPSSPKISCIGQIKKRSNNATANYHLTATRISAATTGKSAMNLNYTKLRKLLSGKNLISPPNETATISNHGSKFISNRNRSRNGSVTRPISSKKNHVISIEDPNVVRTVVVEELDPPLPVVKVCPRDPKVNVNLGKRRGIELKTLQIQPFQLFTVHRTNIINNREISLQQPPPRDESDRSIR